MENIQDKITNTFKALIPEEVEVVQVNKNIMLQQWEVYVASKNVYPSRTTGEYQFFAYGVMFKNKFYIEQNLYDIIKHIHKAWDYFKNKSIMNKPMRRNYNDQIT